MRTKNYGKSWEALADENDVFGYALSFIQDPVEPNLMFFGTEHGLYISIDGAKNWTKFENGYPSVSTMDLVIQERESDLVIGTFGRAIWVLDDIKPLRVLANKGQQVVADAAVTTIPSGIAYMNSTRSANGPANPGSATYEGQNRSSGSAVIKFFAKKPEMAERNLSAQNGGDRGNITPEMMERFRQQGGNRQAAAGRARQGGGRFAAGTGGRGGARGPQAKIEISDLDGNVIRNLTAPVEDGLNQVSWRFDEDPPKDTEQPQLPPGIPAQFARRFQRGGAPALPGLYNVKVTVGDQSDQSQIEVKMDPRENVSMDVLIARRDMLREVNKLTNEVTKISSKLTADMQKVDKVIAALQGKRGRDIFALRNKSNEIKKEMQELSGTVGSGRSFFRGGGSLQGRGFGLLRSISGSYEMPGRTQEMLMQQFKDQLKEVQGKVDAWYTENWEAYLDSVKEVDFSPIGSN